MADEIITVATKSNQFFKIKEKVYEKLCRDFNDTNNIDLSLYSTLFSMTISMGFSLEETLEAALVTNTTNDDDVAALADYLLAPHSFREARYAQTVHDLQLHKIARPRRPKQSIDGAADITKKMKDIVFAYINQLQRALFPQHDPFYIIPFDVQKVILEFFSKRFEYKSDFDEHGIVYWLGCNYGISPAWINPALRGLIEITASSIMSDCAPLYSVVGRQTVRWVTKPLPNQWIMIEFMDIAVIPTHYSLRHYNTWDGEALRNWRLEAGNNCNENSTQWTCLSWHVDDTHLSKRGASHTWEIAQQNTGEAYSQFRIFQHDKNSNFHDYLALSGFEIYGSITARRDAINTRGQFALVQHHKRYALARGYRRNFEYCDDFDRNGLLYFMGVVGGSAKSYDNPAKIGVVNVTFSDDAADKIENETLFAFVGRKTVHCRTNWCAKPWMALDLRGVKIKLTAYTLRHYSAFDTEALRYWNLEGSNDGVRWIIIQQHLNDTSLFQAGQTHTWTVNADQYFSHFRIFMIDRNSNNHFYLACSGIELYGNAFGGIVSEYYDVNIKNIQHAEEQREHWTCQLCTFVNACDRITCEMCNSPEPKIPLK